MSGDICDVCAKPSAAVACSATGPISFAYCAECAQAGREPYGALVMWAWCCGGAPNMTDEARGLIESNLPFHGKTWDEFNAAVAAVPEPKP